MGDVHLKFRTKLAAGAVGVAVLVATPVAAYAAAYYVSGSVSSTNALYQYGKYRQHDGSRVVSMNLTTHDKHCGGYFRMGLRNEKNVQVTPTVEWGAGSYGYRYFGAVSTQKLAINARGLGAGCNYPYIHWGGTLNL
jgi:hypothetical protein